MRFVSRSLSQKVLIGVVAVAAVPAVLLAAFDSLYARRGRLDTARTRLAEDAQFAASYLGNYLADRSAVLEVLAHSLEGHSPAEAAEHLEKVRRRVPGFRTLLRADARGLIVAQAPAPNPDGSGKVVGASVADRSYFSGARDADSTYVSHAFRGRGFGSDPIVAISRAVNDEQDRFDGIVEASLDLQGLERAASLLAGKREVMFIDRAGQALYASPRLGILALQQVPEDVGSHRPPGSNAALSTTDLVAAATTPAGWRVIITRPNASVLVHHTTYVKVTLVALLLALCIGAALALVFGRRVAAPLEDIARWADTASLEGDLAPPPVSPGAPREVEQLATHLHSLTDRLRTSYKRLEARTGERDVLNVQLRELLATLDRRVRERTADLEMAMRAAEQASLTKTRFLANTSHELRTPLNAVIGFAGLLRKNRSDVLGPRDQVMLDRIQENARHLLVLINDVLDMSKIEAGRMLVQVTPLDLADVARGVVLDLESQVQGRPVVLRYEGPASLPFRSDEARVRQVLVNLVGNALKFTSQGEVVVQLNATDSLSPAISVRDTGIGIPGDRLDAIFRPFEQAHASTAGRFGGTGLGLSISRSIADMLGATLEVRSVAGEGSCFTLQFTRHEVAEASPAGAMSAAQ